MIFVYKIYNKVTMNKKEITEKIEEIINLIINTQSIIDVTKESCINNEYYNQETVLNYASKNLSEIYELVNSISIKI